MRRLTLDWMLALPLAFSPVCNMRAEAQQIPRLQIVVVGPDQKANGCGITESSTESLSARVLRNNGIFVAATTPGANAWFAVRTTVIEPVAGLCVFSIAVSVQEALSQVPWGAFKAKRGLSRIVLCEQEFVGSSPQDEAAANYSQQLEKQIKLCLGDLAY